MNVYEFCGGSSTFSPLIFIFGISSRRRKRDAPFCCWCSGKEREGMATRYHRATFAGGAFLASWLSGDFLVFGGAVLWRRLTNHPILVFVVLLFGDTQTNTTTAARPWYKSNPSFEYVFDPKQMASADADARQRPQKFALVTHLLRQYDTKIQIRRRIHYLFYYLYHY